MIIKISNTFSIFVILICALSSILSLRQFKNSISLVLKKNDDVFYKFIIFNKRCGTV